MARRGRKELEQDVYSLEMTFEEAFKGSDGLYDGLDNKGLYKYEKALLAAKNLLKPFSWELKHL